MRRTVHFDRGLSISSLDTFPRFRFVAQLQAFKFFQGLSLLVLIVYPWGVGEDRTDAHSVGRGGDRLTMAMVAALLGTHKNTVRNRNKNGSYRTEMVQTERAPPQLIEV